MESKNISKIPGNWLADRVNILLIDRPTLRNENWFRELNKICNILDGLESSYGPKGFFKMLTFNRGPEKVVKISTIPEHILQTMTVEYPLLTFIAEAGKMQRREYGDHVKTMIILFSKLLSNSLRLIMQGIHPNIIIDGYHEAMNFSINYLDSQPVSNIKPEEIVNLVDCNQGIIDTEIRSTLIEAYDSKISLKDLVTISKARQGEHHSIHGLYLELEKAHHRMPNFLEKARIALISNGFNEESRLPKSSRDRGVKLEVTISNKKQIDQWKQYKENQMKEYVNTIIEKKVNTVFFGGPIQESLKSILGQKSILCYDRVDREILSKLSKYFNLNIVPHPRDLNEAYLDEITIEAKRKKVRIIGGNGINIVLGTSSKYSIDYLEDTIRSCLTMMDSCGNIGKTVEPLGLFELKLSKELKKQSLSYTGKEQLAIDGFRKSLRSIPRCIAINHGLDPLSLNIPYLERYYWSRYPKIRYPTEPIKSAYIRAFDLWRILIQIDECTYSKNSVKVHH